MIMARSCSGEGSSKMSKGAHLSLSSLRHSSRSLLLRLNEHVNSQASECLTVFALAAYSARVADKDANGFGDLKYMRLTTAIWRPFFVQAIASPMGGSGGDTFGYAGFRVCRFANPAICRSPRLATMGAVLQPHTEAHMPGTNSSIQFQLGLPRIDLQLYSDNAKMLGGLSEYWNSISSNVDSKRLPAQQANSKILMGTLDGVPN